MAIGMVSSVIGLLVSYHQATATGATMALTTVMVFLLALGVANATSRRPRIARS